MTLNKRKLISGILYLSVISTGIYLPNSKKYMSDSEKDEMYRMKTLSERTLEQYEKQIHMNKRIEEKQNEIVAFLNSEEYVIRQRRQQKIEELKVATGLNVVDYKEIKMNLSFYTSLEEENTPGKPSICANGEQLNSKTIANNVLPFNTNVFIENFGHKIVQDRGSHKYFRDASKADVYIPRNNGESNEEYYNRVNNLGRKEVTGYILEVE